MSRIILLSVLVFVSAGLIGSCGPRQFPTLTIYDKPAAFVRLEFDRTVKTGSEHSHPISLTPEQVAAVLGGVRIEEPRTFVQGDILAVFSEEEIAFFAPLIAQALSGKRDRRKWSPFMRRATCRLRDGQSRPEACSFKVMFCI